MVNAYNIFPIPNNNITHFNLIVLSSVAVLALCIIIQFDGLNTFSIIRDDEIPYPGAYLYPRDKLWFNYVEHLLMNLSDHGNIQVRNT